MIRSSLFLATLGVVAFLSLLGWLVWVGYQNTETALKDNLNVVLRDNNLANHAVLSGHVQRLKDLSLWVQKPDNLGPVRNACTESPDDDCLEGLTSNAELSSRLNPPQINCGQHDLLSQLLDVTDHTYKIGPTVWMDPGRTMAPVAHVLPGGVGWIAACVEMDSIREIWRRLDLPEKSSMALVRGTDYHLWIREPFKPELLGRDLSDGPLAAAMRAQAPSPIGIADIIATKTDFVARTVEWSPIGIDDLVLVAGYPKDYFFSTWLDNEWPHLITLTVFSFVLACMSFFSWKIVKRKFEEVQQLARRNSVLFEMMPIGLAVCDMNGKLTFVNDAYASILGYSAEEALNLTYWEVTPKEFEAEEQQQLETLKETGRYGPYEKEYIHKDGRRIPVRLYGVTIRENDEKFIWSSVEDISSQKENEAKLKTALVKADNANKAKSIFLANMSHELRTPLNAIIGFSDMMLNEVFGALKSPQYKGYCKDIHQSGSHLLSLINDVLDMSKIEAEQYTVHLEPISLAPVVDAAVTMVRDRAARKNISLQIDLPETLQSVIADHRATKQILINLLTNAVKFTNPTGQISISAQHVGEFVSVSVIDTGIGMKHTDIDRALLPFVQIEREAGRHHEGTGLGLPLCNQFAKLQGGKLSIESTLHQGTAVTFTLPINLSAQNKPNTQFQELPLSWAPSMSVGVHQWDRDHQVLLFLIEALGKVGNEPTNVDEIGASFEALVRYTETHLTSEEDLMRKLSYPQYEEHKEAHDSFRAWMDQQRQEQQRAPSDWDCIAVSDFLKDWWLSHILKVDMAYEEFFAENRNTTAQHLSDYQGVRSPANTDE